MRGAAILLALALLVLAGCASSDGASQPDAPASIAADDDTGSLQGQVIDDEQVPVDGARVLLSPGGQETTTAADGSFRFTGLEPGAHALNVTKDGYANASKQLDVRAGVIAQVRILLIPNPIVEGYTAVHTGALYLNFAYKDVHRFTYLDGASCKPCEYWWRTQPGVRDGRLEAIWTPSVNVAMVNQAFRFGLSVNANNGSYHGVDYIAGGDPIWSGVLKSGEGFSFESHDARKFPKNETITMVHADTPDDLTFGLLQRIDLWLTLAYNMDLAEDYTILPGK